MGQKLMFLQWLEKSAREGRLGSKKLEQLVNILGSARLGSARKKSALSGLEK